MSVVNSYETVIIFSLKNGEEAVSEMIEKFKSLVEEKATSVSMDDWGKRRLAYPINYETDGHYVLFNFDSTAEFPAELDRVYKITEGVLRSIIVKK